MRDGAGAASVFVQTTEWTQLDWDVGGGGGVGLKREKGEEGREANGLIEGVKEGNIKSWRREGNKDRLERYWANLPGKEKFG